MTRLVFAFLLLATTALFAVQKVPEIQNRALIELANQSTVQLWVDEYAGAGSGFVVSMDDTKMGCKIVVGTARHMVVDNFGQTPLRLSDPKGPLSAYLRWSPGSDAGIAVFYTEGDCRIQPWVPATLDFSYKPEPGERIFGMGYPLKEFYFNWGRVLDRTYFVSELNMYAFTTSYPTTGGNSGGPMFDMNGHVVGILVGGFNRFPNITYVVPISYLEDLL